ncbi:MAG: ATP-binding protein [Acidimicrobiales bacterium]|nr:ATP-binding protein [Acidimicrobiales bacterium]MYD82945.1 ATP-binding protein [Acidimicrobiales bacterium]MYJ65642.1 ATP-binding protein [Acidimicrobiales bacterium]
MAGYRRPLVRTIVERLHEPPERLVAVFGPRQSGKTTAVRQALDEIPHSWRMVAVEPGGTDEISDSPEPFDSAATESSYARLPSAPRDLQWLVDVWAQCRERARSSPHGYVLVLDEVQELSDWSTAIKGLWDADRLTGCPLHVVILGSAPIQVQSGLNESLMGRFEPIVSPHWSFTEMASAFGIGLDEYVFYGGYPGAMRNMPVHEDWHRYVRSGLVEPTIERDVVRMTSIRKPALMRRLFEVGARYSGQILSYTKMVGQLQDAGNTTTLTGYLQLLSQVGLLTGLEKHVNRAVSAKASTPKLNVLNTGLMSMVSGYRFEEALADRSFWGRLVESAVGAHLINTMPSSGVVKYWRDRRGQSTVEVDFVVHRGPSLMGIEVKTGGARESLPGLEEFGRRFDARTLVVGEGGVPLDEFFSVPATEWVDGA